MPVHPADHRRPVHWKRSGRLGRWFVCPCPVSLAMHAGAIGARATITRSAQREGRVACEHRELLRQIAAVERAGERRQPPTLAARKDDYVRELSGHDLRAAAAHVPM